MTSLLTISIELLGASDPPHAQMYTMGPTTWIKHLSPMIGRIFDTKVNAEDGKHRPDQDDGSGRGQKDKPKSQKYDFQAIEMQLQGPVPPKLYHRYVEFWPFVGLMFASTGIRGKILNTALHSNTSASITLTSRPSTATWSRARSRQRSNSCGWLIWTRAAVSSPTS